MHPPTAIRLLALLSFSVFCSVATAAECSDGLPGDYAVEKNGPAVLRIEQSSGRLHTLQKDDRGQWGAQRFESPVVAPDMVRRLMDAEDGSAPMCGVRVPGGALLKVPVGQAYRVSSATEKSTVESQALTGYLFYEASGFAVSAVDLYPVARAGEAPAVPAASAQAASGREVPGSAICPGRRLPDMRQAAFDGLPALQKSGFHRLNAAGQSRFVCGQYLNDLMGRSPGSNASSGASREGMLKEVSTLIRAGHVPRNAEGQESWASASSSLLSSIASRGGEAVPFQKEVYALFVHEILPLMGDASHDEDRGLAELTYLLKELVSIPQEYGVVALKALNRQGVLRRSVRGSSQKIASEALQFNTLRIPADTFDYLLAEAGPGAANDASLMTTLIDRNGVEGIRRMLHAGANPAQKGWLSRARMNADAAPEIYPLLLNAALAAAQGNPAQSRALGDQLTLVLGRLLARCPKDAAPWTEIDVLVAQGARVQGVFDNQEFSEITLGVFARRCPEGFKALLQRGLPLDTVYPYPAYAGPRQDTPLLMYLTVGMEDHPPQAQVLVEMLKRHNNANVRPACTGCNPLNALEMAIFSGDTGVLKVLLDFGADPNDPNPDGRPPFIRAVIENSVEMLEMMNAKTPLDVHRPDRKNISLLAWANCAGAKDAAAWLSRKGAVSSGEALCQKR